MMAKSAMLVGMLARRTLLGVTLLAATALASAQGQPAQEFRIGGVLSLSGPYGTIGDGMRKGAELAVEMRGGKVLGVPVKFSWEDDETKPQVAVAKTTRLLASGTHMLFGAVSSGSTLAMMKLNEPRKVPLLVTLSSSDDITGKEKNAYTFRTGTALDMENRMMTEFVVDGGKKRIQAVVADYSVGREIWKDLRARLEARGVTVVGEHFTPLGSKDYSIVINRLGSSDADIGMVLLTGNDSITFLKQAEQVGLQKAKPLFGTMFMDESMGLATGSAGVGVDSTLRYHASIDNPANKAFVAAYQKKYNEAPGQAAGQAFDGMAWFLDVVERTGSWDSEKWVKAFSGSQREQSVLGNKLMRTCDNQAAQAGYFGHSHAGTAAQPVVMRVTKRFDSAQLFTPCK